MRDNAKGFTLVEAMIAVLLLTVMMLASIVALVDIKNRAVENVIRQEAVKLGQELVNDDRNEDYLALATGTTTISPILRHASGFDIGFSVVRVVTDIPIPVNTAKSITYTITWSSASKSNTKTYITRTMVGRR